MAIGAFFDIDGTLYRDSLMIEHFKKLVKYEVFDPNLWHSHVKLTYEMWKKRRGDYDDYMLELAELYINSLKGINMSEIEFIADQVINLKGDSVYAYTRDQISWHHSQGHKVFFISGSPEFLVRKMAAKYEATDYRGTKYITDETGHFTGTIIQMWDSESKDKAIKDLVDKYNIDLSVSYAYGDTNGDLSMLSQVGYPIAINPTQELLENIRKDAFLKVHTDIIVERKDNIYKLTPDVTVIKK
ncbi:MAG: HAD-IB family hydrolase [Clostridia bacterium]|nr:HAD-IB family hydrolase [Clostridia bacterium]